MVVFSQYPIDTRDGPHVPALPLEGHARRAPAGRPGHACAGRLVHAEPSSAVFRLSSKSHWDVPIDVDGRTVHFLVSHPTPPVFDGPEDRNGTRNSDEIRFWADYVTPGTQARYIYDDEGRRGGLEPGALFVIAGDQNSDPLDGDSMPGRRSQQLLEHPRVNTTHHPGRARAAVEAAALQGGANADPPQRPARSTPPTSPTARPATCAPTTCCRGKQPANRRLGGVLAASRRIRCSGSRASSTPRTGAGPPASAASLTSDHRLVWADLDLPEDD